MRVVVDERAGAPAGQGQDRGGQPKGGAGGVDVPPIEVRRWTTEQLLDGERALLAVLEPGAARDAIRRAGRVLRAGEPIEVERAALGGMQLAIGHLLGQHAMMLEGPGVGDGAGVATHCTCGRQTDDVPCQHLACLLLALVVHLDPDRPPHPLRTDVERWRAADAARRRALFALDQQEGR